MAGTKARIEAVARAFYNLQDCARGWDREPERLKATLLSLAQSAIATLEEHRGIELSEARDGVALRLPADPGECGQGGRRATDSIDDQVVQACAEASYTAAKLSALSREQIRSSKALIAQSRALLQSQALSKDRCAIWR